MSVSKTIWRTTSRNAELGLILGFVLLAGCSNIPSAYEHADTIDTSVHRGSEALAFSSDSRWMLSGGWEGEIALWSMQTQRPERVWQAHEGPVHGLEFSGRWVVSGGLDGWVKVWERDTRLVASIDSGAGVERAAVSDRYVVTGHRDGSVRVWQMPTLELLSERVLHEGIVKAVAYSAQTDTFASVGEDRRVFVWSTGGEPRELPSAAGMVRSLEFSPDGDTLFGGGWANLFKWRVPQSTVTTLPTDHWGLISGIQYVPTSGLLATISRINDSSVLFLDPETGTTRKKFTPQRLCGGDISMSANGRYLSTTGDDGAVRIWDMHDAPVVASMELREEYVE